jgi:imidazolonepropionase
MRRAGASYEDIARAGGGIASTVAATKAASDEELRSQSRRRLHALMAGGATTVEVKSGYGLDTGSELRLLEAAASIGQGEAVRIVPTLLAAHAIPLDQDREAYVTMIVEEMIPAVAKAKLATSVDAFCESIAFTPAEVERVFTAARAHGLPVRLHAEQLSNLKGAALAAKYKALSADHLEHLDVAGAKAMAAAGSVAVLLPGAFYALQEKKKPPVQVLRDAGVPMAIATDCNPGTSPLLNPQLAMNMACTLFGLTPEEAVQGMTINAARALGLAHEVGSIEAGKAADLAVWPITDIAELGYWVGMPGPERRIFAGQDA